MATRRWAERLKRGILGIDIDTCSPCLFDGRLASSCRVRRWCRYQPNSDPSVDSETISL